MDGIKKGFNSNAVHAGFHSSVGPVNPPIEESSTSVFTDCDDGAKRFASRDKKQIYARFGNSSTDALEKKLATLEKGKGAILAASGMAAVNTIYFYFLDKDSHVISTSSMYGPSRVILESPQFYKKWGVQATCIDTSDITLVRAAIRPNTKLIMIETPANPTLSITDIKKIAQIGKENNIPVVVDNTFCSPYLQNPLELGADVVIHSLTKSIGGHADAVGGVIITNNEEMYYGLRGVVTSTGPILSPHSATLFFKGVKTLGLRMEKMQENAKKMVGYLQNHPKIEWVSYPGIPSHPQFNLVSERIQMKGPGSMLTFGVRGGLENAKKVLNSLKLIVLAVSLGGVESLIQHPASMTHAGIPRDERIKAGITDELVRLSMGIEDFEDLRQDLDQALEQIY